MVFLCSDYELPTYGGFFSLSYETSFTSPIRVIDIGKGNGNIRFLIHGGIDDTFQPDCLSLVTNCRYVFGKQKGIIDSWAKLLIKDAE
jgi:hypothetical protein